MSTRTPTIYATGKWQIKTPFNVNPSAVYTCTAIRSFEELETVGVDIYAKHYAINGLSVAEFEQDKTSLANMVTLVSDTEPMVEVPDTYILGFPDKTSMPYTHIVLSASLGVIPSTLNLTDVKSQIEELILDNLGYDVKVNAHQAGFVVENVDMVNHQIIESNRKAKMASNQTPLAKQRALEQELETLREKNRTMEQYIKEL